MENFDPCIVLPCRRPRVSHYFNLGPSMAIFHRGRRNNDFGHGLLVTDPLSCTLFAAIYSLGVRRPHALTLEDRYRSLPDNSQEKERTRFEIKFDEKFSKKFLPIITNLSNRIIYIYIKNFPVVLVLERKSQSILLRSIFRLSSGNKLKRTGGLSAQGVVFHSFVPSSSLAQRFTPCPRSCRLADRQTILLHPGREEEGRLAPTPQLIPSRWKINTNAVTGNRRSQCESHNKAQ